MFHCIAYIFIFWKHISETCRACFYHICDLRRTRKSLSPDLAKQIAVALVISKLDYCNSLFHNMPEKDISRLQCVQNCLARMVTKAPWFSRSVPILKRLHWLPVQIRVDFNFFYNNIPNPKIQPTCIYGWLTCPAEMLKIYTPHKFK